MCIGIGMLSVVLFLASELHFYMDMYVQVLYMWRTGASFTIMV